jgi:NCAIR mutase (PurE)-related protein
MTEIVFDWEREARTGTAEAVLCSGKTADQIANIIELVGSRNRTLLLTRLDAEKFGKLPPGTRASLDYDEISGTAILGKSPKPDVNAPGVVVVAAGTSDMAVANEALRTLAFYGFDATLVGDVGVAGLWRLMERIDMIRTAAVVIAVAGMEGALFSVVAGLVQAPVIAVPTSVGYGVAAGGKAALNAALASCAPGVVVVNIDNGFGAAMTAVKILRMIGLSVRGQP